MSSWFPRERAFDRVCRLAGCHRLSISPCVRMLFMELALETHGLTRCFGDFTAVDGIDLAVPKGSFYGFLGPNGAGKSTTIKCLTGLLRPTCGTTRILGLDPALDPVEVKRRVGVVPEDLALFDRLTAPETLVFVGRVHGLDRKVIESRSEELLSLMDLSRSDGVLASDFSHGMRKKLALAAALLPAPRFLFLDEPFEGVDALASRQFRQILSSFVKGGGTVFLTSHILEIVEKLCDHLGVIRKGKLVAQGTVASLRGADGGARSLEEIFLDLVGDGRPVESSLAWLSE